MIELTFLWGRLCVSDRRTDSLSRVGQRKIELTESPGKKDRGVTRYLAR